MKRHEKYKDSGLEWLGKVPDYWESWKISHAFTKIGSGTTPQSGNPIYHENGTINWLNTGDLNDGVLYSCAKKITPKAIEDNSSLKLYPKGSLVIAMYGATIGKTALLQFETTTNQACCVFSESDIIDIQFLQYWFKGNKEHILNLAIGGGQPNISQDILKGIRLYCPNKEEQTLIANYLNHKTAQLDTLIAKKEQLINLLQEERTAMINQAVTKGLDPNVAMKDSGIEWLGDIPEHWNVVKVKHFTEKIGSGVTPRGGAEVYQETGVPLLRSQNIYFDRFKIDNVAFISEEIHNSMNNSKVFKGDVLLNITGGSIGRCFYLTDEFKEANVNQHVCIVRPNENIVTEYLHLLLSSDGGQIQISLCQQGGNREALNFEQLKNFPFALPNIEEQLRIIDGVHESNKRMSSIIEKSQQEIDLLKEYKTALISEVVTGKVDVREAILN
ncbi:restriction endonuclease subunit S [Gelidibacter sp.]|uniref:restriction endonuclease subunit S n=1 Tax=Gelidibacter sp. TaxID=2018083 RepID=UPI0032653D83